MEESVTTTTSDFLLKIGNVLSSSCPAASRFYLSNLERHKKNGSRASQVGTHICLHCGSAFCLKNSSLTVHSSSISNHIKKLLRLEEHPWKLNCKQKKKIQKFYETSNKIVYYCKVCKNKTVFPGDKHKLRRHVSSSSTPLQRVKIKKGDLLAGLFIATASGADGSKDAVTAPEIVNSKVGINKNDSLAKSNSGTLPMMPSDLNPNSSNKDISSILSPKLTPTRVMSKTPAAAKQSSRKKRKKTLLEEIMEKEKRQCLKAKPGLASFLVPL